MRRSDRQITDPAAISALLEECRTVHLSCNAEGAPYVVPMNYGFALAPGLQRGAQQRLCIKTALFAGLTA